MKIRTRTTELFGIDLPIFAFSHSRRVVAAVSRAGGLGVLGAAVSPPDMLAEDLDWIRHNSGGRPFGVDLMIPHSSAAQGQGGAGDLEGLETKLRAQIPESHQKFVEDFLEKHQVATIRSGAEPRQGWRAKNFPLGTTEAGARGIA